jgi:hypothetical protein
MKPRVLKGTKQEIADRMAQIEGEVREAIVFIDDPAEPGVNGHDIFAEMDELTVDCGDADDSRPAIYERRPGE